MAHLKAIERMYQLKKTRIVGFGSSNTECCYQTGLIPGWLHWLDFGLRRIYGRCFLTLNAGVSGQHTKQLLERFDEDVALFQPHLVFLTVGGNDSNPKNKISIEDYEKNLKSLLTQIRNINGCEVILQTYYAPLFENLDQEYARQFQNYMQKMTEVAKEEGVILFDHLSEWIQLRKTLGDEYEQKLMHDDLHLNELGNQLWAYRILEQLVGEEIKHIEHYFRNVKKYHDVMLIE